MVSSLFGPGVSGFTLAPFLWGKGWDTLARTTPSGSRWLKKKGGRQLGLGSQGFVCCWDPGSDPVRASLGGVPWAPCSATAVQVLPCPARRGCKDQDQFPASRPEALKEPGVPNERLASWEPEDLQCLCVCGWRGGCPSVPPPPPPMPDKGNPWEAAGPSGNWQAPFLLLWWSLK